VSTFAKRAARLANVPEHIAFRGEQLRGDVAAAAVLHSAGLGEGDPDDQQALALAAETLRREAGLYENPAEAWQPPQIPMMTYGESREDNKRRLEDRQNHLRDEHGRPVYRSDDERSKLIQSWEGLKASVTGRASAMAQERATEARTQNRILRAELARLERTASHVDQ
jgi:hypothetical protein